jgi:hypothetical protein
VLALGMSVLLKLSSGVAWAGAIGALYAGPPQPTVLTPVDTWDSLAHPRA